MALNGKLTLTEVQVIDTEENSLLGGGACSGAPRRIHLPVLVQTTGS